MRIASALCNGNLAAGPKRSSAIVRKRSRASEKQMHERDDSQQPIEPLSDAPE